MRALLLALGTLASAQQVPDLAYAPPLPRPAYGLGAGPRVAVDAAHHNFHTAAERYRPFAELLRRDGYRMESLDRTLSPEALKGLDVLVIANALHARNVEDWSLPTPSAFAPEEVRALKTWVEQGGALLLIVDHMPFPGAVTDLAQAFGLTFSNGFAADRASGQPWPFTFEPGKGLEPSAATRGRDASERVDRAMTYTGSAFRVPQGAIPVFRLDASYVSLEPTVAWAFKPDTPRVPLEGWCQGALLPRGKGRVAVFGEAAMFTAQLAGPDRVRVGMNAPEAAGNHQLLLNTLHWLTRLPGLQD